MKISKREKKSIIIHMFFYLTLIIVLIIYFTINLLPKFNEIESDKVVVKNLQIKLNNINLYGLDFDDFNQLNNNGNQNRVITEILSNISKEFYEEHLINKNETSYDIFINNKKEELNSNENKTIVEKKAKQIKNILPLYSEYTVSITDNILTDYKFINYIESILETFNLTTNNSIGISNLVLLNDFSIKNDSNNSLESNIFYIPLNLSLKGSKSSIINFLYFVENVGNISVSNSNINLNTNYGFLGKNGIKRVMEGSKYSDAYNIFENQIIDISGITISEYIDSSYNFRGNSELKDFILSTQGNDDFEINVNLMFYVKGQPAYKIVDYINGILKKYKKVLGLINSKLKNENLKGIDRIRITKYNNIIKGLKKEINILRVQISKKNQLEETYKSIIKIDSIISPMLKKLNK